MKWMNDKNIVVKSSLIHGIASIFRTDMIQSEDYTHKKQDTDKAIASYWSKTANYIEKAMHEYDTKNKR